ncbi:MAG: YceI family protein [Actinobacteria bacterium]|nr:YceI family protein [Actinomycetota bacterium]
MSRSNNTSRNHLFVIIGGLVALVVVAAIVVVVFVLPDDAPPKEELPDAADATGEVVDADSLDGTWNVVAGDGDTETYAGYRVEEVFAAGAQQVTAIGQTNDVTGTLTVAGGEVTDASITVDMTTLESDKDRRDDAIRSRGIQTDEFPEATFALSEPVTLPGLKDGIVAEVDAVGDLTLHGVTQQVTVALSVRPSGDTFTIDASVPVAFGDFDIDAPSVGGFVTVEDEGSLEFRISFQQR